jgi:hypothetical protein
MTKLLTLSNHVFCFCCYDPSHQEALNDPSVLLAHEVAYVLGQMQNRHAVPYLIQTLQNNELHPMVRHEVDNLKFNVKLTLLGSRGSWCIRWGKCPRDSSRIRLITAS